MSKLLASSLILCSISIYLRRYLFFNFDMASSIMNALTLSALITIWKLEWYFMYPSVYRMKLAWLIMAWITLLGYTAILFTSCQDRCLYWLHFFLHLYACFRDIFIPKDREPLRLKANKIGGLWDQRPGLMCCLSHEFFSPLFMTWLWQCDIFLIEKFLSFQNLIDLYIFIDHKSSKGI